jgi:hypothetical protein
MTMDDTFDGGHMAERKLNRGMPASGAFASALLCMSLSACALGPTAPGDEIAGTASELIAETGVALPRATWLLADAGCEGRLDTSEVLDVMLAEGEPDLRVVVRDGLVVCVDSASAIADEVALLANEGGGPAEHLGARHRPTAQAALASRTGIAGADPSPQPSTPQTTATATTTAATRPTGGDPSPQPSDRTRPTAGDPSPQPSQQLRAALDF